MFPSTIVSVIVLTIGLVNTHHLEPIRSARSTSGSVNPANAGDTNGDLVTGHNENMDMISWFHGHTLRVGNTTEADVQAILNSMKLITRPESTKFPRLKVYNYKFDDGDSREVLVLHDPDEEKQWIVNMEDLDLRQNLIVFKLGDLGFGFAKENTFVVLRKSMATPAFHYAHLAYIQPRKRKGSYEVEWDNIKPKDLLPIPLILTEPDEDHAEHCDSRKCGLKEFIFGTCPIVKLSCQDLKKLPLEGHEKERIEALLREKQPFMYELARSLSVNNKYLQAEGDDSVTVSRHKRSAVHHHGDKGAPGSSMGDSSIANPHFGDGDEFSHHSAKKDPAFVAAASQTVEVSGDVEASMHSFQRKVRNDKAPASTSSTSSRNKHKAPGMEATVTTESHDQKQSTSAMEQSDKPEAVSFTASVTSEHEIDRGEDKVAIKRVEKQSVFDKLLTHDKKPPVTAANLTLGQEPIQSLLKLPQGAKSYFENVLDKIRNSPPSKYTVRPYECITCEPIGTFMSEYAENPLVSYVVNNLIGDIFRDVISKRNLFSPEAPEVLQEHATIPYIGYGTCQFSVDALERSPKSMEIDDIIDFYSETLAVDCEKRDCESQRPRVRMRELLTSRHHFVEIWPDLSLRINKSCELPKNLILTTNEFRQFMVSLILSAYTTEYRMQAMERTDSTLGVQPNHHVSPRMKFITRMTMRIVDEIVKSYPQHLIKGLRYMLQVLQEKYLSLVAEELAILEFDFQGNEKERNAYKTINRSDRLQVLALKDFMINGIAPITRSGGQALPAFATFFQRNHKRILNMVIEQGIGHEHKKAANPKSAEVDQIWSKLNGESSTEKGEVHAKGEP